MKILVYSLLITMAVVVIGLTILGLMFQAMLFKDYSIYLAMFSTLIFTIIFCTQLILSKFDQNKN